MPTLSYADVLKKTQDINLDETTQGSQQEAPTVVGTAQGHGVVQEMSDKKEPQSDRVTKPEMSAVGNPEQTDTGEDCTVVEEDGDDDEGDNDSDNKDGSDGEEPHWSTQSQLSILLGMTLQGLRESHYQERRKWKEAQRGRKSCAEFREALQRSLGLKIQTCVALGLGSFSGNHKGNEDNPFDASMAQLVAFEAYVDIIATHQGQ